MILKQRLFCEIPVKLYTIKTPLKSIKGYTFDDVISRVPTKGFRIF